MTHIHMNKFIGVSPHFLIVELIHALTQSGFNCERIEKSEGHSFTCQKDAKDPKTSSYGKPSLVVRGALFRVRSFTSTCYPQ